MSMAIQRSKYTGDPGLGGFFKGFVKAGLGLAGMVPGVGEIARGISGRIFPPAPGTTTYAQQSLMTTMPVRPTGMPGSGVMDCRGNMNEVARRFGVGTDTARAMCNAAPSTLGMGRDRAPTFKIGPVTIPLPYLGVQPGPDPTNGMMDVAAMQAGKPCPVSGYHWNKSGYFLKSGEYIPPGTKMVKNRRRNPANPRATSNAITRIKGAKRYAKSLSSISIRKTC